ncbi:MAG: hypothetical protein IKU48_04140 [Clostridia bacterium]|nr:hypothetical protein [Clostridia bacterium]
MKKTIVLFLLILTSSVLFSCRNESTDILAESANETTIENGDVTVEADNKDEPKRLTEEEKAAFYKVVEFDLPKDFRDAVVKYMYKCAEIKWQPKEDYSTTSDNNSWSVNLSYKKGTVYHGVPYSSCTSGADHFSSLIVDGKYFPRELGYQTEPGLNCYTAIQEAYQTFIPTQMTSHHWLPGDSKFCLDIVGDYEYKEGTTKTEEICTLNGKDKIYDCYSLLQKGDIIYTVKIIGDGNIHCRLVVDEPTIVKNGLGKIIPSRSYVTCIESTNAFDKTRTDGVKTTWYVNHTYSFDKLFNSNYVPITLKGYSQPRSEMEAPYLGLDMEITPALLSKGMFTGVIRSNFPLVFGRVDILDKSGNVVASKDKCDLYNVKKMGVRNTFTNMFDTLEKGKEYTFVLTAGIVPGNVELARVNFTYGK